MTTPDQATSEQKIATDLVPQSFAHTTCYKLCPTATGNQRREKDWQAIMETMHDSVMILDQDFHIVSCNAATAALAGQTQQELIGRTCCEVFHKQDQPVGSCPYRIMKEIGEPRIVESELDAFGQNHLITVMPIENEQGKVTQVIHLAKKIQATQQDSQKNLYDSKMEGILELAGAVCHELSQPLQIISGYAEILALDLAEDERYQPTLKVIEQEVDRLAQVIRKVQTITRYRSKNYLQGIKIFDINDGPTPSEAKRIENMQTPEANKGDLE